MLNKRPLLTLLLFICIFSLLAGCSVNINIGAPAEDTTNKTEELSLFDYIFKGWNQQPIYESRASIYIAATFSDDTSISSSDIAVSEQLINTVNVILQSPTLQSQIHKEYPSAEYTLSLEQINNTEIFALIATSENPEHLEDICNEASLLFCELLPTIIEGIDCKIIDYAKSTRELG